LASVIALSALSNPFPLAAVNNTTSPAAARFAGACMTRTTNGSAAPTVSR